MRYVDAHERTARRLTFEWFNEALFIVPAVSVWVLGVRFAFDAPVGFGYPVHLTQLEFWGLATTTMLAGIGGATLRAAHRLQPAVLAHNVRLRGDGVQEPLDAVEREIRAAQFSVHEVLDLPAAVFLGYGVIFTDDAALALSIGYSLLAFLLAQPDDQRLVRATMLDLQR